MRVTSLVMGLIVLAGANSMSGQEVSIDLAAIAKVFQFPANGLLMDDMRSKQDKTYAYRMARKGEGYPDFIEPESIVASKWISGRLPNSFSPLMITIAKQGTFLSAKTQALIDDLEKKKPSDPSVEQLGRFSLGPSITGVLYPGREWIPSDFTPNLRPGFGIISEIRDTSRALDIRIAWVWTFFASELLPVPGGEAYFAAYYANSNGEGDAKAPPVDIMAVMKALNEQVLRAVGPRPRASANRRK